MFDLHFYSCILGYTLYLKLLKQDPTKIISKTKGNTKTIYDALLGVEEKLSIVFKCNFFTYYMKIYFKYFKLNYMEEKSK